MGPINSVANKAVPIKGLYASISRFCREKDTFGPDLNVCQWSSIFTAIDAWMRILPFQSWKIETTSSFSLMQMKFSRSADRASTKQRAQQDNVTTTQNSRKCDLMVGQIFAIVWRPLSADFADKKMSLLIKPWRL